jgi:hypothetical protein
MVLTVNGRRINEVIIDPHYEKKHKDIDDALILNLVRSLDGKEFRSDEYQDGFEFFMLDRISYNGKFYGLVWCMQDHSMFIGVINAFRR